MTDFSLAFSEIFLLSMACIVLLADVYLCHRFRKLAYGLTLFTLAVLIPLSICQYAHPPASAFTGLFVSDPLSAVLKAGIAIASFFVAVYSRDYLDDRGLFKGEYFVLLLCAVLGMFIMVSAGNFLSMYLGLELLSLALYAMVAIHRDSRQASEAAMKYFVLGAIASGMLLYGMSMLYGATGSLDLATINRHLSLQSTHTNLLAFGLVFIVAGIAFKLGAAPFHMWAPDVYQGAPTPVTLFLGSAPKLAGFALAYRLLVDGLGGLVEQWQLMLIILAVLSIGVGNVIAIAQQNIKRMLAYSAIAHMGYMLLGLLSGTQSGYAASLFYVLTYTLMTIGAFGVIILMCREGHDVDRIDDLRGLAKRSPWFALVMLVLIFSMAGVPPFVGFWSKWFVLREVVNAGYLWLAAVAVFFAIIGAFYYLRLIRMMYFETQTSDEPVTATGEMKSLLSVNGFTVLLLGLMPGSLLAVCLAVFA